MIAWGSLLNSSIVRLESLYSSSAYENRAIKSLIAKFTTILLHELPITLDSFVFMRFSIKLVHYLNVHATHSTAKMLE